MQHFKLVFTLSLIVVQTLSQNLTLRSPDGRYEYLFHKDTSYTSLGSSSYQVAIDYCENVFEGMILKCESLSEWSFVFNFIQQNSLDYMFYGVEIPVGYDYTHTRWHDGTLIDPATLNLAITGLPVGAVSETLPYHIHTNGESDPYPIAEGIICKKFLGYRLTNSTISGSNETLFINGQHSLSLIDCGGLCLRYTKENTRLCIEFGLVESENKCWLKLSKAPKDSRQYDADYFELY